jgi:hypothetical protein
VLSLAAERAGKQQIDDPAGAEYNGSDQNSG